MRVEITGVNLPGRSFCRPDGSAMPNVHVGVQVGRDPAQLVRADAPEAHWHVDVDVVRDSGVVDFRGPVVQGKRGERFIYLTWGDVGSTGEFEMFRRAKLMLSGAPRTEGEVVASIHLTDDHGLPVCARLRQPTVVWT